MASGNKPDRITVIDAIETLTSIVELDRTSLEDFNYSYEEMGLDIEDKPSKNIEWLKGIDSDEKIERVKEIFNVILNYVESFYKEESMYTQDKKTVEGIKNIMLLVGEAAKKVESYNDIDKPWITTLPEYRNLQQFYKQKIDRKIDQSVVGQWILGVAKKSLMKDTLREIKVRKKAGFKKVIVDLESVRNDGMYELLLMDKEDGSHFFNSQLIRNMKLVCDFGGIITQEEYFDIFGQIGYWRDRSANQAAETILRVSGSYIADFYRTAAPYKDNELVTLLNKGVFALMLAANPYNLKQRKTLKSCSAYFHDFQCFLRELLEYRNYQKALIYNSDSEDAITNTVISTAQSLLRSLFVSLDVMKQLLYTVDNVLNEARHHAESRAKISTEASSLSTNIMYDYTAMIKLLKYHSNGPLMRDLEFIEQNIKGFDTIMQGNLPNRWFDMFFDNLKAVGLRLPSPTKQNLVEFAEVTDEFKGFLFNYAQGASHKKLLLINLQDRLSWREHARCTALEHMQNSSLFNKVLTVVTLGTDTEFYHQVGDYSRMNNAKEFKNAFLSTMKSSKGGYFFPEKVSSKILLGFAEGALNSIHEIFFDNKQTLDREERLNFISLAHTLIELKILEIIQPDAFSITCKDGIDTSCSATAMLFCFLKLINREILSEQAHEYLSLILYGPTFINRERTMRPDQFYRVVNMVRCIESARDTCGFPQFTDKIKEILNPLFDTSILTTHIDL